MADLNARIIAKASGTASEEPLASDLEVAELAVNTADGKLFTKHTDGSVVTISGGGGTSATAVAPSAGVNVPDQSDISLALNMSAYSGSSVVSVDSYATTWNLVGNATFTTSWARFPGGALDTTSGGYIEPDVGTTLSEQFDGDFTIAFWINKASNNYGPVFDFRHNDAIFCWVETSGSLTVGVGSSGNNISSSVLSNGDHHIAIVRDGTTIRLYVDGALDGSRVVDPVENVFFIDTSYKTIGAYFTGAQYYFDGYIADFVIANGHAVWSAAFTPPTSNVDYFQETGALPLPNGAVGDLAYNSQNGDYYYATSGSSWDKVVAHSSTLTPSNGEAIVWNASSGAWEFGSSQGLLGDLPDVDTSTNPPTDGQVLAWDNAAGQWEPTTPASALVSSVNGQTGAVDLALSNINDVYTGTTNNGHLMDSKQSVTSSSWTAPYDGKFYRAAGDSVFRFAKTDANGTDFESQITSLAAGDYFEIEYSSGYIASFTLTGAAVTVDLDNYYVILSGPSADELTALSNSNSVLIRSNKFSYNGLSNGQVLTYDSTQGRWEAADPLLSETATTWSVTASGNTHYVFSGDGFAGTETDPVLYVVRGQTYKISNTMNAHPFRIQRTSGTSGVAYNDGITNNGVINGTLEWEVRLDAPSTLYYQCTQHAAMGGTIQVLENPSGGVISDLGDVGDVLDYNEFSSIGSWNSEIVAIDTGGNDFPDAQGEWSIYESTTAGTSYLMINKTTSSGADYTSLLNLVVANPTDYSFKIRVNNGDQSSVVALTAAVLQVDDRYRLSFSTADLDPADYNEGGYSSSNSSTGGNGPYTNVLELDLRLSSLYTVVADGSVLTWNATNEYWEPAAPSGGGGGGGATAIDDLTDVDTSTVAPTDGQALIWDNAAGKWEPGTPSDAVDSVNGQTGVVSLGVEDLDDFALVVTPATNNFVLAGPGDSSPDISGEWGVGAGLNNYFTWFDSDPIHAWLNTVPIGTTVEFVTEGGYVHTAVTSSLSTINQAGFSHYISFAGYAWPTEITDAFTANESITVRDSAGSTSPLVDGDILQWNSSESKWQPAQLPSGGGGAVDSVNGQTGVVSLGIQDMDDYAPQPATDITYSTFSVGNQPSAGAWHINTNFLYLPKFDSNGVDQSTNLRALAGETLVITDSDGTVWTMTNVTISTDQLDDASARIILDSSEQPTINAGINKTGGITIESTAFTLAPLPLVEGDTLSWDATDQKFKPVQPSDAVDSVNGQTGVVSLAADDLTDIATQIDTSLTSSFETAADYVAGYITTNNPRTGSYSAEKLITNYGLRAAVANAYPDLSKRYDVTRIYVNLDGNGNSVNNRIILGGNKWEGSSGAITGTHHGYSLYLNNAFHVLDSTGTLISVGSTTALSTSGWVEIVSVFDWQNGRTSSPNLSIWVDGNLEVSNVTMTGTYTQKGNDEDKYWASGYWNAGGSNYTAYVDDLLTFQQDTLSWGMTDATIGDISQYTVLSPTDGQILTWVDANSRWEPADAPIKSDTAVAGTGSSSVSNIVTISQVDYDALATPDAGTLYFIV